MLSDSVLLLILAGFAGGFIAGLTGIGTGIVMLSVIPLILPTYSVPDERVVTVIIANAVFATMVSSLVNVLTIIRRHHFHFRETLWVGISSVGASFLVFEFIVKSSFYSRALFNGILILVLFSILIQTLKKLKLSNTLEERVTRGRLFIAGGAAGTLAALTGLGGGVIAMPLLNLWMRIDILKAKSISFGLILAIALWLSFNNLFLEPSLSIAGAKGLIIFPMMWPLLVGIAVGSPCGIILSEKIPGRYISILFMLLTALVTIQKIMDIIHH